MRLLYPNVRGLPFVVGMAPESTPDGRSVALFGVAYARTAALRTHAAHVLHGVSLLPAPARDRDGAESDSARHDRTTVDNSALAVRVRYPTGFRDAVAVRRP